MAGYLRNEIHSRNLLIFSLWFFNLRNLRNLHYLHDKCVPLVWDNPESLFGRHFAVTASRQLWSWFNSARSAITINAPVWQHSLSHQFDCFFFRFLIWIFLFDFFSEFLLSTSFRLLSTSSRPLFLNWTASQEMIQNSASRHCGTNVEPRSIDCSGSPVWHLTEFTLTEITGDFGKHVVYWGRTFAPANVAPAYGMSYDWHVEWFSGHPSPVNLFEISSAQMFLWTHQAGATSQGYREAGNVFFLFKR